MLDKRIADVVSMCAKFYVNNSKVSGVEYARDSIYVIMRPKGRLSYTAERISWMDSGRYSSRLFD